MVSETLLVGILNLVAGIIILAVRGSLRFIVGGYLLIAGLLMILVPMLG